MGFNLKSFFFISFTLEWMEYSGINPGIESYINRYFVPSTTFKWCLSIEITLILPRFAGQYGSNNNSRRKNKDIIVMRFGNYIRRC